jgi:hypothetical protein
MFQYKREEGKKDALVDSRIDRSYIKGLQTSNFSKEASFRAMA